MTKQKTVGAADIAAAFGLPMRTVRYVLDHQQPAPNGRQGKHRTYSPQKAFTYGLAATLSTLGFSWQQLTDILTKPRNRSVIKLAVELQQQSVALEFAVGHTDGYLCLTIGDTIRRLLPQ